MNDDYRMDIVCRKVGKATETHRSSARQFEIVVRFSGTQLTGYTVGRPRSRKKLVNVKTIEGSKKW